MLTAKVVSVKALMLSGCAQFTCCIRKYMHNKCSLTKEKYGVKRANFSDLKQHHVEFFTNLLEGRILTSDNTDLTKYNLDWMNSVRGSSSLILRPKTTEEVSRILSFCNENKLAVCPQGGNTSIVGGSVPVFDEVIISTELMNGIIDLDETSGVLVCQSGCILENLDNVLAEKNLMVPLDLGAKGSCHIGGNVSTNAGGLRLLRYGNLHGNVLGLEVVKANGEILDCLSTLKKDNTGYHLKNIFIGSEGTLGFITKVAFQCPPRPKSISVAFLGAQNFSKVLKTFKNAKQDLGEILSAFEVMDASTMEFAYDKLGIKSPIGDYPFYILLESSGSDENHDMDKMTKFLDIALTKHTILNGTVVSEPSKVKEVWSVRERIPDGFKVCGCLFCYDVSLPIVSYFQLVNEMKAHMKNVPSRVFGFGHLGDGNLHLQIETDQFSTEIKDHVENFLFPRVKELEGSISAEHGMGFLKANYLDLARPASVVNLMRDLKTMFDPNGILNPYKIFPWNQ